MNSNLSAWWLLAGICLGGLGTAVVSYVVIALRNRISEAERKVSEFEAFDRGWETALGEFQSRQLIFPRSSRGLWKKRFLVVHERIYFKNLPIGGFSEHVIEVSRELDFQNIEALVKIVASVLGALDLKQLFSAGLKMTKETKILDEKGDQIGTWTDPKQT